MSTTAPSVPDMSVVRRTGFSPSRFWDQISIYLPVLIMGLLALASYWLLASTPEPELPVAARPPTHEPDYFMRRFSVKVFDPVGALTTEVYGVEARHHPDTDTIEIDDARIRSYNPQRLLTVATAEKVTSNGDSTVFILEGNASVVRQAGRNAAGELQPRMEFHGEYLRVTINPEHVESDRPVLLIRGRDQITADVLDYRGDSRVAVLTGRVRAQLAPR